MEPRRRKVMGQAVADFLSGYEGNIEQIAEKYFGSTEDKDIKSAYNLMSRVRRHFDATEYEGRMYQFANVGGPGGAMNVYRIILDEEESLHDMVRGVRAAQSKVAGQYGHAAVSVTIYPGNQKVMIEETQKLAQAAIGLITQASQHQLAMAEFYEKLGDGIKETTDEA